jgi:capsular exopolysaccharide synthesis family protein
LSVTEYLRILRRYWPVVIVAVLVGAGIGYAVSYFSTPKYQSTATLFVATQNGTSVAEAYQNNLFSQERVISYASLATSEQVAARAVDQLKAPISADELRSKITALPMDKTVMLKVAATDSDPALAQAYAGAVSDQLVNLVGELETSRRGGSPAAGAVVVDDADFPTTALGLSWWMKTSAGAAAGLVVGFLLAILIGVFDKRLRGREPIEEAAGSVLLGSLPEDSDRRSAAFVDLAEGGIYAEWLRELRNNVRFAVAPGSGAPKVIAVTSPSKEEGRTTVAIDLAVALAETGRSVVLVDGDLYNPQVAELLPFEGSVRGGAGRRGLSTVLAGEDQLADAVIPNVHLGENTIAVLPAGPVPPRPGSLWALDRTAAVLQELERNFDYVIIDTPPLGEYSDGANIAALGSGAIVLARVRSTRATALRRALQVLKSANVHVIGTVATFDPVHRATRRKHGRPRGNGAAAPAAPEAGQNTETIAPAPTDQLVRPGRSKAPGDGESN